MLGDVEMLSTVSDTSDDYNTGMMDINGRAAVIKTNIIDATPYMYVSLSNILFSTIWIGAIIGIFVALKKKKAQIMSEEE